MKFLIFILTIASYTSAIPKYDECPLENEVCEFWLVVQEQLTMVQNKEKVLVSAHKGKLHRYDEHPSNYTTKVPIESVVTVDGYPRMVIAINKTVPGPPLVVYEHQKLIIHVRNRLLSDSVTIHWHGLHQRGTPFMDGVGYISQCPIVAGQTFTYRFTAEPKGTFWYHSHVGAQRTNGVFGALIIKERPVPDKWYPVDAIMTVGDWHHSSSEEVYIKMIYGNFKHGRKYKTTKTLDGGRFSGVPWVSALIEGKGRYLDPQTGHQIQAPLTWYKVKTGGTYRFRVIQTGTIYPLRISVDGHRIVVVASDGYDIKPMSVESFIINPGERYDFILYANQPTDNYWIRAVSLEADVKNHTVEAVLHYEGADLEAEPTTTKIQCTRRVMCTVLNCPFWYYPTTEPNTKCILVSELQSASKNDPAPTYKNDSQEHFLNFAFPGTSVTPGAVNGRKFEFAGVNSLTQDSEIGDLECDRKDCGKDKVCYCHYQLDLPFNKTIQMVWINMGRGAGWGHPIHLHGHSFYVLKMAYANQDPVTGKLLPITELNHKDVDCGGGLNFCNEAKWANESWNNGNIPGLNLKNPPRKDTLIIPTGGYAVIRIRSDNPGKWFAHCHIEVHALDGMAMVVSEGLDHAPKAPKGFPLCNNFYSDKSRDHNYVLQQNGDSDVLSTTSSTSSVDVADVLSTTSSSPTNVSSTIPSSGNIVDVSSTTSFPFSNRTKVSQTNSSPDSKTEVLPTTSAPVSNRTVSPTNSSSRDSTAEVLSTTSVSASNRTVSSTNSSSRDSTAEVSSTTSVSASNRTNVPPMNSSSPDSTAEVLSTTSATPTDILSSTSSDGVATTFSTSSDSIDDDLSMTSTPSDDVANVSSTASLASSSPIGVFPTSSTNVSLTSSTNQEGV